MIAKLGWNLAAELQTMTADPKNSPKSVTTQPSHPDAQHPAMNVRITIAPGDQARALVDPFYEKHGGRTRADDSDVYFIAECRGQVVGTARFCHEENTPMLRGMLVDNGCRHQGVGVVLLDAFDAYRKEKNIKGIYCVPDAKLESFYARIGFKPVSLSEMPEFLVLRKKGYIAAGNPCVCMKL